MIFSHVKTYLFYFFGQSRDRPSNNVCSGATFISTLPFSVFESNEGAVTGFVDEECGVSDVSRGLFYEFTPTEDTIAVATVSDQTFNAVLSLYRGSCEGLQCRTNTEAQELNDLVITFTARAGETNHLMVSGEVWTDDGNFQLDVRVSEEHSTIRIFLSNVISYVLLSFLLPGH
jgi:hypothetical protein